MSDEDREDVQPLSAADMLAMREWSTTLLDMLDKAARRTDNLDRIFGDDLDRDELRAVFAYWRQCVATVEALRTALRDVLTAADALDPCEPLWPDFASVVERARALLSEHYQP